MQRKKSPLIFENDFEKQGEPKKREKRRRKNPGNRDNLFYIETIKKGSFGFTQLTGINNKGDNEDGHT